MKFGFDPRRWRSLGRRIKTLVELDCKILDKHFDKLARHSQHLLNKFKLSGFIIFTMVYLV